MIAIPLFVCGRRCRGEGHDDVCDNRHVLVSDRMIARPIVRRSKTVSNIPNGRNENASSSSLARCA